MKSLLHLGRRFLADDKAAEITELGLVLVLIVVVAMASIKTIGIVVQSSYAGVATTL